MTVVEDMEDQAVVSPFEIAVQVRVQARQAQGYGIITLAQAHGEGKSERDPFTGTQVRQCLSLPMGVDAIHGLSKAILDHEAQHQPLDVLAYLDLHLQHHRLAHLGDLHRSLVCIQQAHTQDACFTGTGDGLDLAGGEHFLTHRLALALGHQGVVVVQDLFGFTVHGHATVFQKDRGIADRLDR